MLCIVHVASVLLFLVLFVAGDAAYFYGWSIVWLLSKYQQTEDWKKMLPGKMAHIVCCCGAMSRSPSIDKDDMLYTKKPHIPGAHAHTGRRDYVQPRRDQTKLHHIACMVALICSGQDGYHHRYRVGCVHL